jgi:hypothetical protein
MVLRTVVEPAAVGTERQLMVFETLRLLIPFDLPQERKIRIGRPGDGSYVLVDRLRKTQPILSFGIGPSVQFESHMAARGHDVLLFDHTVDKVPEKHERFTWFREGIAGLSAPERKLFTLAEHVRKLPPQCDNPILKMDVEGAEWGVFHTASVDLLCRFEQITFELHDLARLEENNFNAAARSALAKLASRFTLCHVHANNFCSIRVIANCFPIPESLELTYVRSDLVTRAPSTTMYPTALDQVNFHQFPDLMMWFFPFMPGSESIKFPAFARSS